MDIKNAEPFGYESVEAYHYDLLCYAKERIEFFCQVTATVAEDGKLEALKGKLLFEAELERLSEASFTEEEIHSYEGKTMIFGKKLGQIRRKGEAYMESGGIIPLEYLFHTFRLNEFEKHMVILAFTTELDRQFERVYCLLQDDYQLKMPTIDLCIQTFTLDPLKRIKLQQMIMEHWEILNILFSGLEETAMKLSGKENASILSITLKLDPRILQFIYNVMSEDLALSGIAKLCLPSDTLQPLIIRKDKLKGMNNLFQYKGAKSFFFLHGEKEMGKKLLVKHFCKEQQIPLILVDASKLMRFDEGALGRVIKSLRRESLLKGNALLCFFDVSFEEEEAKNILERLLWHLKKYMGFFLFTSTNQWSGNVETYGYDCLEIKLDATTTEERIVLWETLLLKEILPEGTSYEGLADKYMLTPGAIQKSLIDANNYLRLEGESKLTKEVLFASCQKQLVHRLSADATRIQAKYRWDDLILPKIQKNLLKDACNQVEFHHKIYRKWGFEEKIAYGRGVSMIFYGPPGTGKTMGAQVIANELNLELYKVDMASILSKYVGESEKKLGNIFEQGKKSQSILFFDEADALFGKRSETKDAQDKYANASTAYLLQKVEEYEGIIILATNFLQNFDNAFCRRFKFIIEFPAPDMDRRKEIWKQVLPEQMPMGEELDFEYLAQEFSFSGSQIKNIAVAAAFLAAGEGHNITMRHILIALKREQLKVGKNMIVSDFGQYYYLMEN